jgi:hypothetical protein
VVPDAIASYFRGKPAEASQSGNGFTPAIPGRAVPDVAMDGDPNTGMLIGQQQDFTSGGSGVSLPAGIDDVHYGEYRIGGTSLSSPLFAGVMALADQAAGKPHGFANPALYKLAGSGAFHDVVDPATTLAVVRVNYLNSTDASGGTETLLRTLNQTNTLHTIPGYDDVTGLGTPAGVPLLRALAPDNAVLKGLAATAPGTTPAPGGTASPTPGTPGGTPGAPSGAPRCKAGRRLVFVIHHTRGDAVRRVVVRLRGGRTRVIRGRQIRRVTVKSPARTRRLTIVAYSRKGVRTTSVRTLGPCGTKGRVKVTHKRV